MKKKKKSKIWKLENGFLLSEYTENEQAASAVRWSIHLVDGSERWV